MKKLTALLLCTAAALAALYFAVPALIVPAPPNVTVAALSNSVFYESIPCDGVVAPADRQSLSLGVPSTVLMVHAKEGDAVKKGDLLLTFRPMTGSNAFSGISALYPAELAAYLAESASESGNILSAAEYFAKTGELPDYFLDFYMPEAVTAFRDGSAVLLAPIDGIVTRLRVAPGDIVTGAFASVTVSDTDNLVAKVRVPERHAAKLAEGQSVNIYSTMTGSSPLAGRVSAISDEVRTVGGLLSAGETVLECTVSLPFQSGLRAGFSVQAYIFLNIHRGILLPYGAVRQDESGGEYVFLVKEGRAVKQYYKPFYENDDGILPISGFAVGDLVILDPPDTIKDGQPVALPEGVAP